MRDGKNTARDLFRGKTKLYLAELFSMFHFLSFEMGHVMLSKKNQGCLWVHLHYRKMW